MKSQQKATHVKKPIKKVSKSAKKNKKNSNAPVVRNIKRVTFISVVSLAALGINTVVNKIRSMFANGPKSKKSDIKVEEEHTNN